MREMSVRVKLEGERGGRGDRGRKGEQGREWQGRELGGWRKGMGMGVCTFLRLQYVGPESNFAMPPNIL